MGMTGDEYSVQIAALLPRGPAWESAPDSAMGKLLRACAEEFSRIDGRCDVLMTEARPVSATELLAEWEKVAGLPDACQSLAQTTTERRANLARKITTQGGQSRAYYIAVAATLGYTITISDLMPYEAGHFFNGSEIAAGEWVFVWRVTAPASTVGVFLAGQGTAGTPLRWWGDQLLECVINSLRPAHTHVLFSYT